MDSLIEIPLAHRLEWAHSPRLVGAEFSTDGQTVFVHMHTPMLDLFAVVAGYAWWIALVVFVVGVAISWWWLLRVNARPQRGGLPYCRKCNYELSGQVAWDEGKRAWAMAPSDGGGDGGRCPECGAELAKVRAKRGVATWKRRLWPAGLAVVVGAVFLVAGGLRLFGSPGINAGDASRLLSVELAEWVEREGIQWLRPFVVTGDRIVAIDAASGREIREVVKARTATHIRARLTPDGMTMLRLSPGGGRDEMVLQMNAMARGGREGTVVVPLTVHPMVHDDSPFVALINQGERLLLPGRSGQEDLLLEVNLDSGGIRTLHKAPSADQGMHAHWSANRWDEPSVLVRFSSFMESMQTKRMVVEVFDFVDGGPTPRVDWKQTTQVGERHAASTGAHITVLPDGERAYVPTSMHGAAMLEFDLVRGGVARAMPSPGSIWFSIASAGSVATIAESLPEPRFMIYHTEPTELIAMAPYPGELVNPVPYLNPDGGRAAAIGFIAKGGRGAPPGGYQRVLLLYDLAPALEAVAERRNRSSNDAANRD